MRRALLLLIMIAGLSLVVWSGWHNFHKPAAAAPQANAALVPDSAASADPATAADASPLRGKPAPAFTLADITGKDVSLSDFKGHPLVVNFWGTYCEPCKIEMPWLQELSKKYASDGFDVIGVTYDSEVGKAVIAKDTAKLGVTYPILLSDPQVENAYLKETEVLPMSFYVDKTGTIVAVTAGLGDKDQLETMVKKTIAAGAQ
jgi:thiol-disulfide isomerase/thioredoxin